MSQEHASQSRDRGVQSIWRLQCIDWGSVSGRKTPSICCGCAISRSWRIPRAAPRYQNKIVSFPATNIQYFRNIASDCGSTSRWYDAFKVEPCLCFVFITDSNVRQWIQFELGRCTSLSRPTRTNRKLFRPHCRSTTSRINALVSTFMTPLGALCWPREVMYLELVIEGRFVINVFAFSEALQQRRELMSRWSSQGRWKCKECSGPSVYERNEKWLQHFGL
jgi:hypothetical protein